MTSTKITLLEERVIKGVTITMSVKDAEVLYALVGKTNGRMLNDVYRAFTESGLVSDGRLRSLPTIHLRDYEESNDI